MQRVDRTRFTPPAALAGVEASDARRRMLEFMRLPELQRAQTAPPRSDWVLHAQEILQALQQVFRNRCAFCETVSNSLVTYRFRPAMEAAPIAAREQGHLHYGWLADAWQNLYPICPRCVPADAQHFPVLGARATVPDADTLERYVAEGLGLWRASPPQERALLLDPCQSQDIHRALRPLLDGRLIALSDRGEATLHQFTLNHPELIEARRRRHEDYLQDLAAALTDTSVSTHLAHLTDFTELEFGGTWYLLLRRLVAVLALRAGHAAALSVPRIGASLARFYALGDVARSLQEALAELRHEDQREPQPVAPARGKCNGQWPATLEISNFKSIHHLRLSFAPMAPGRVDPGAPALLVLGENAAGKSTLLEALALGLADYDARRRLALDPAACVLNPGWLGAAGAAAPEAAQVTVTLADGGHRTLRMGHEESVTEAGFNCVPVFAYGAFRQYRDGRRVYQPHRHIRNLFDGSLLANPRDWLLGLDDAAFNQVVQVLRELLSADSQFDIVERDPAARICSVVTRARDSHGHAARVHTPLDVASSGFRSLLAMACDVMQGLLDPRVNGDGGPLRSARAVVVIDEIEAHLHPRWKIQVMGSLRRALPQVMFVATTHDPLCLRGLRRGEVRLMRRIQSAAGDDRPALQVELLHDLPDPALLRVDQLLTSDLFQLGSTTDLLTGLKLEHMATLLARQAEGSVLSQAQQAGLRLFQQEIGSALPIGDSEAQRLVQEAVADYLARRRSLDGAAARALRTQTRQRIVDVLERR